MASWRRCGRSWTNGASCCAITAAASARWTRTISASCSPAGESRIFSFRMSAGRASASTRVAKPAHAAPGEEDIFWGRWEAGRRRCAGGDRGEPADRPAAGRCPCPVVDPAPSKSTPPARAGGVLFCPSALPSTQAGHPVQAHLIDFHSREGLDVHLSPHSLDQVVRVAVIRARDSPV